MTLHLKSFLPNNPEQTRDSAGLLFDQFMAYIEQKGVTLYPAQEEAILAIYDGSNVILNTPTGSGKSLVATALHFNSLAQGRRSFYTSPIKALANEKFLSLCEEFGPDSVGMMTGDGSVNPSAPIICCTAEVLANLALREGPKAAVDDVVMDEFHYYSDKDRGVAWQVPLLTLPQARFLLMSATLGDVSLFESTMTRLNRRLTVTVKSRERPVPLTFKYQETPLHETVHGLVLEGKAPVYLVNFTQRECAEEAQNLLSIDICSKDEKQKIASALDGVRFSSPYGQELKKLLRHGVGLHHAGLLPKYRVLVERLSQKGLLKVICGTDTLGVGVNVPIRSVVFTKLCKFDGSKSTILTVRDFHQIAGRAGRKGFDNQGLVVAQAPEHVIDNLRAEMKAQGDAKKLKKIVKKKPPEFGFVMWTQETFKKLIESEPEALVSRFQVSHGMLLNVLGRPNGCDEMRAMIRSCHESDHAKERLRVLAFQMFRSLVERKIIQFVPSDDAKKNGGKKELRVNVNLQEDFSLHHQLALYLIDTVKLVDPYSTTYSLDVLTLAESIIENPELILRKQLDRIKQEKMAQMKAEGVEYEERIAKLDELEYPKPNREFIYETFNAFLAAHPWISRENIKPKSIVREMYENFMTFGEYIKDYELQRSEGLLLRYLAEVYKVLVQTVPVTAKDEEMETIVAYVGGMIRQIDSSLLEEWEKMRNPDYKAPETSGVDSDAQGIGQNDVYDITQNKREFIVAIRNEVFTFVKIFASGRFEYIVEALKDLAPEEGPRWTSDALKVLLDQYRSDHDGPLLDRTARYPQFFSIVPVSGVTSEWLVYQALVDSENHNDVRLKFILDLKKSKELARPSIYFLGIDSDI